MSLARRERGYGHRLKARASARIGNAQADFTRVERPSEGRCATRAAPQEGRAGPTTVSTAASQPSREYNCAISLALIPGSRLGPDEILSALGDLGNRMTKTATRMRSVIRRTLFLFVAALSLVRMFAAGPGPARLRRHLELRHRHSTRTPPAVEGQSLLHARRSRGVGTLRRRTQSGAFAPAHLEEPRHLHCH